MVGGIIGKKLGMIQVFDASGHTVGVTVVQAGPCTVVQKRGADRVQLGFGPAKESRLSKPVLGQFRKAGIAPLRILRDFSADDPGALEVGQEIRADIFKVGDLVKVMGTSKGKGFAGVIKRHHFGGGRASHGSRSHRIPGSVGQCTFPARVFKGKRLPGRMGGERVTVPSVTVLEVRAEENLLLLKGPIPGPRGGIVFIRKR